MSVSGVRREEYEVVLAPLDNLPLERELEGLANRLAQLSSEVVPKRRLGPALHT